MNNQPQASSDSATAAPTVTTASPISAALRSAITLLRCPRTGQRLILRGTGPAEHVCSEDGTVQYEVRDGLVLFVTGQSKNGPS